MVDKQHLAKDGQRFLRMRHLVAEMNEHLRALIADDAEAKTAKSMVGQERPGHKYLRRKPKPGGGYEYVYEEAKGRRPAAPEDETERPRREEGVQPVRPQYKAPGEALVPPPPKPKPLTAPKATAGKPRGKPAAPAALADPGVNPADLKNREVFKVRIAGKTEKFVAGTTADEVWTRSIKDELDAVDLPTGMRATLMQAADKQAALVVLTERRTSLSSVKGLGPLRSNLDYGLSFDPDARCPNRLTWGVTVDELQHQAKKEFGPNFELGEEDMRALQMILKKNGVKSPCVFCFVESPRIVQRFRVGQLKSLLAGDEPLGDVKQPIRAAAAAARAQMVAKLGPDFKLDDYVDEDAVRAGTAPARDFVFDPPIHYSKSEEKSGQDYSSLNNMLTRLTNFQVHAESPYIPYTGELWRVDYVRAALKGDTTKLEEQNRRGGLRMYSNTDFQLQHVHDVLRLLIDETAVGTTSHAYTKQYGASWLASCNVKVNASLIMKPGSETNPQWEEHGGSYPIDKARDMRKKYQHFGTELLAANDAQLEWALNSPDVDYVIPLHASGASHSFVKAYGAQDFTPEQSALALTDEQTAEWQRTGRFPDVPRYDSMVAMKASAPGFLLKTGKMSKERFDKLVSMGVITVSGHYNPLKPKVKTHIDAKWYGADKGGTNAQLSKNVLDFCKEHGLRPPFAGVKLSDGSRLIDHPNYIKVVKDWARTDSAMEKVDVSKLDWEGMQEQVQAMSEDTSTPKPDMKSVKEAVDTMRGYSGHHVTDEGLTTMVRKLVSENAFGATKSLGIRKLRAMRASSILTKGCLLNRS